ncbi:MAG: hypothetical protein ACREB3_14330, partial [Burkholderiales bacterium]
LDLLGIKATVEPMLQAESRAKARRPRLSALATDKLIRVGIPALRSWDQALEAYAKERADG